MTGTQIYSFATLITALAIVVVLMLAGVPRLARLLIRCRYESIRDDCVDAILDGRLRRGPEVERLLEGVENAAKRPRSITFPRAFALYRAFSDLGVETRGMASPPSYEDMQPDEQRIMSELDARSASAYKSYMLWGSPLGWAAVSIILIMGRVRNRKLPEPRVTLPALTREAADLGPLWISKSREYASR